MADLWSQDRSQRRAAAEPLARRMRPRSLDEFLGQEHIVGPGQLLRRMLDADRMTPALFWGPPGTGKTALAEVIAVHRGRHTSGGSSARACAAWSLTERLGLPECEHALAQAAIYMATAEKSNASARAIWDARSDVRNERTVPVPKHLRDSSYPGAKALGHGEKYQYPHDPADGYVLQEYLGVDRVYHIPTDRGYEATVKKRLDRRRPASDDD